MAILFLRAQLFQEKRLPRTLEKGRSLLRNLRRISRPMSNRLPARRIPTR
jgi:hypothetical protein